MIKTPARPSSPRPSPSRGDATRAAILAAAESGFAKSGLAGARTDAIAAAARVNKAMLYYYFKSKNQLFEAVVEDHFRQFNELALQVLTAPGPARTVLLQYVGLHFDFISAHHRHASLYQQLIMGGGKPLERLVKKYFLPRAQALDQLLERGTRGGEFRAADRVHTAISITALIVFYFSASNVLRILTNADAYTAANLQHRKQEVLEFIRHALFRDPSEIPPEAPPS
jgi:TetR/AcrR family transcriptional regulator